MAKKITEADAGLVYRCGHCDAKCDDTFCIGEYVVNDVYLGRIDETKKKYKYYCSRPCAHYTYIQAKTELILDQNIRNKVSLDRSIKHYRETIKQDPKDARLMLEFIKLMKSIIAFNNAWLAHKSEYELHELRLKAKKFCGDFIETHHDNIKFMNYALKLNKCIDDTKIELFN